ncbi:hypothetical protein Fmac_012017 [Flemingia macrophylla]|uniref:Uncharacterized protein n=1 Tax=Flemingia macrophylla TaxID=520843 RepID=A0ABD1MP41_9FABA
MVNAVTLKLTFIFTRENGSELAISSSPPAKTGQRVAWFKYKSSVGHCALCNKGENNIGDPIPTMYRCHIVLDEVDCMLGSGLDPKIHKILRTLQAQESKSSIKRLQTILAISTIVEVMETLYLVLLLVMMDSPGGSIEVRLPEKTRWHPRGHLLLAGFDDFSIWMWNTDTTSFLNTFTGHGNSVMAIV